MKANANFPVAVLDVGSGSVRLVTYEGINRAPREIQKTKKNYPRLISKMSKSGEFGPDSAQLVYNMFQYAGATVPPGTQVLAYGTEALREGTPRAVRELYRAAVAAFDRGVKSRPTRQNAPTLNFEILSGEKEAYIAARGVIASFPGISGLVIDLGSGSGDIALVEKGDVKNCISLPIGAAVLSKKFKDQPRAAANFVHKLMRGVPWLIRQKHRNLPIWLVGGNFRALSRFSIQES